MGFPGFRSRSIAGVRLRSPSGNGYAAPPIPAALGAVKVLLALPFYSLANSTVRACAHRSRLELCCKNQGLGLSTVPWTCTVSKASHSYTAAFD